MIRRALLSVSDKTGILEFAIALAGQGVALLSTGGSARLLADAGLAVTEVADYTGFPEMLDGRVKTLHPSIHGGLLARRDLPAHMQALADHSIGTIDMLVVNLYPFHQTVDRPGSSFDDAIENIDIGGPAMVRSAAKNWRHVVVVTDPSQYDDVLEELARAGPRMGQLSDASRFALAVDAFNRIARYDAAISDYLSSIAVANAITGDKTATRATFPAQSNASFIKVQDLRYGENPHQRAALYRDVRPSPGSLVTAKQLQGKELSFNTLADADAAWECVRRFDSSSEATRAACVIVKHANPCGVALGATAKEAYDKAFSTDPTSAFGGIIAFNVVVDRAAAEALTKQFVEVLIAPGYDEDARALLAAKTNVRVLEIASFVGALVGGYASAPLTLSSWAGIDVKRIGSGLLMQTADDREVVAADLRVVTSLSPNIAQMADLLFAWRVAKFVKSNAIVFCAKGMTLGVGAGQMSRIDSARIASIKAGHAGLSLAGSAVASDAFFPFRDGLDVVADAGATCVIQPGGSMRDDEVIAAANERGIAMVLTGVRHFRH